MRAKLRKLVKILATELGSDLNDDNIEEHIRHYVDTGGEIKKKPKIKEKKFKKPKIEAIAKEIVEIPVEKKEEPPKRLEIPFKEVELPVFEDKKAKKEEKQSKKAKKEEKLDFDAMNYTELKKWARKYNIKKYTSLKKRRLIEVLKETHNKFGN